jgi:hypothetical protein
MTNATVIIGIIILGFIIVCLIAQLWIVWGTEQNYKKFRKRVIETLIEHDNILFPPQIKKPKGKVIPYVRPTK